MSNAVPRPAGALSLQTTFENLLHSYRTGDADAAVSAFATWSVGALNSRLGPLSSDDVWESAAILLLHLEAGMARRPGGRDPKTWAVHHDSAERLINDLYRRATENDDVRLKAFCRDVRLVQLFGSFTGDVGSDLAAWFPDDPVVQLALGSRMEYAMRRIEGGPNGYWFGDEQITYATSHGQFGPEADEAIERFRKALDLDPSAVEARVRLGHVIWLLDRRGEAERELRLAREEARSFGREAMAYLAGLFLGQLHEETGASDAAIEDYRGAILDDPGGQAARLAFGRLLVSRGESAEGWRLAADALIPSSQTGLGRMPDPWATYDVEQHGGMLAAARLKALRPYIRIR